MTRAATGAIEITQGAFRSGAASLNVSASLAPDGVPTALSLDGRVGARDGAPIALPGGGGGATLGSATLTANLGRSADGAFEVSAEITDLDTEVLAAPSASLTATGRAQNLADPDARAVALTLTGRADGLGSDNADVASALGARLALDAEATWQAGAPARIERAQVDSETLAATFEGAVGDAILGRFSLSAADLSVFSSLAGRDLSGRITASANGSVGFDGLFDLSIDATSDSLALGLGGPDQLFAGQTRVTGGAARGGDGIAFQNLVVTNPQLNVAADGAVGARGADLRVSASLTDLNPIDARLGGPLSADLTVSGSAAAPQVDARLSSDRITLSGTALDDLDGTFRGTLSEQTGGDFNVEGQLALSGLYAGEPLRLSADIEKDGGTQALRRLEAQAVDARARGEVVLRDGLASGNLSISIPELSRLAPLLLLGDASGNITAQVALASSGAAQNATVDANVQDLRVGSLALGFASANVDAQDIFGVPAVDGRAQVRALDVGGFDVGTATLTAVREGTATDLTINADLQGAGLSASGRLETITGGFAATVQRLRLEGPERAATLEAPARVEVTEAITIDTATLSVGDGQVTLGGVLGDTLNFEANITALPLAIANLVQPDLGVSGVVSGTIDLEGRRDDPTASVNLKADEVSAQILRARGVAPVSLEAIGSVHAGTATIETLSAAVAGGTLNVRGTVGSTLNVDASLTGLPLALANVAVPDLDLSGTLSGEAAVRGRLRRPSADFSVRVADGSAAPIRAAGLDPLTAEVSGRLEGSTVTLAKAEAQLGEGSLSVTGTAGRRLDLDVVLTSLPLAIANGFQPGLGVEGSLSGTAQIGGRPSKPVVSFDISSPALSSAATRSAGFASGTLRASGTVNGNAVTLREAVVAIGGGEVRASGPIAPRLGVKVDLTNLPLALAASAAPDLGLSGRLAGRVEARGPLTAPEASFDLSAADLSVAQLRAAGVGGISLNASGRFASNTITLASLSARGAGLSADASGQIPLGGSGLDLSLNATAPLTLANALLASRGARVEGSASVDLRVSGSLSAPSASGAVRASGVNFSDPQSGLIMRDGVVDAALTGDTVTLRRVTANLGEGTLSVTGTIGLAAPNVADLRVVLDKARFADGEFIAVTLDGDLTVQGGLTGTPEVSGRILVDRAEITVPESFAGTGGLIDVRHVRPSASVLETLRRARVGPFKDEGDESAGASGLLLDVTIDAPARIFVRGRGIDAELGGQVRVTGPISNVAPVGSFELRRGRLSILTQRVVFTEGEITLLGDLDPTIRLVAESQTSSITVRVIVEGSATNPTITFESTPELPQDEVLAQFLFGRSLNDLSTFQLAQLAAAVAELAGGGGGPNIFEQIRVFTGLDNLEIITDDQGNTAAEAGTYINDRIYLGVRAGEVSSGVTVNLDVTRHLRLRAEALTDETAVGIFYENEY
ncbi:MAG: translocation/assembly module TamB domain-containing protein [Pseudomonadota bacterium]